MISACQDGETRTTLELAGRWRPASSAIRTPRNPAPNGAATWWCTPARSHIAWSGISRRIAPRRRPSAPGRSHRPAGSGVAYAPQNSGVPGSTARSPSPAGGLCSRRRSVGPVLVLSALLAGGAPVGTVIAGPITTGLGVGACLIGSITRARHALIANDIGVGTGVLLVLHVVIGASGPSPCGRYDPFADGRGWTCRRRSHVLVGAFHALWRRGLGLRRTKRFNRRDFPFGAALGQVFAVAGSSARFGCADLACGDDADA